MTTQAKEDERLNIEKKAYKRPELVQYGGLTDLTKTVANTSTANDNKVTAGNKTG